MSDECEKIAREMAKEIHPCDGFAALQESKDDH